MPVTKIKGNTVLDYIPSDYCPENSKNWFIIPEGLDAGKKLFFYDYSHGTANPSATMFLSTATLNHLIHIVKSSNPLN